MREFHLEDVRREHAAAGKLYLEFLRVPAMSVGLYEIAVGGVDPQTPHTEDELYYVTAGRATLLVGSEELAVSAGSIVYVPAEVDHRFHSVTEALSVLVFFAPAEYSQRAAATSVDATG